MLVPKVDGPVLRMHSGIAFDRTEYSSDNWLNICDLDRCSFEFFDNEPKERRNTFKLMFYFRCFEPH